MTPKKWYKRAAAMLTAFALMFVLIPLAGRANVKAADEKAVTLSDVELLLNGKEVTNDTKVNNGDEVFFTFKWKVDKSGDEVLKNPLVADIDFKGIYLLDTGGPLQQGVVDRGTYKIIKTDKGNKIEFYLEDSQLQQSNIEGEARFKGKITYDPQKLDDDGKVELKATVKGNPVLDLHPNANVNANVQVSKSADGQLYKDGSGNYFQKYTVSVSVPDYSPRAYTINSITDTPTTEGKLTMTGDITVSGTTGTVTGLKSSYSSFDDITGIKVGKNSSVTFEYTMQVDRGIITDRYNTWPYGNKVVVNKTEERYATPNVPEWLVPNVSKTGVLDEKNHRINWTVEIAYTEFNGNKDHDRAMVKDMSDTLHKDSATNEELKVIGADFSEDVFWNNAAVSKSTISGASGNVEYRTKYSYTYATEYEDNGVSVDRRFSNNFKATVDGFGYDRRVDVTVPGGVNPIDKQCGGPDGNGNIDWTITFKAPSKGTVSDLTIDENCWAGNGLSHRIIPESVTVNGAAASMNGNTITIGSVSANETVTVKLKTEITDDKLSSGRYYNKAAARYKHNVNGKDINVTKEDTAEYNYTAPPSIVTKDTVWDLSGDSGGTVTNDRKCAWKVTLDLSLLDNPTAGETITLNDEGALCYWDETPVAGLEIKDIYKVEAGGRQIDGSSVSFSGNTITVVLTQDMINAGNAVIHYYQEPVNGSELNDNYMAVNKVTAYRGNEFAGRAKQSQWKVFSKEDLLKKDYSGDGNLLEYTIDVNAPGIKLSGETGKINLTDEMGSLLRFQESSLIVLDGSGNPLDRGLWSYTYDSGSRKLSITLPDNTHCIVKYNALVDLKIELDKAQGVNHYFIGGKEVTLDEVRDEITNTASLMGEGGYSSSKSKNWSGAEVSGEATIVSDTGTLVVEKYDSITGGMLSGAEFSLVPGIFENGSFKPYTNSSAHPSFREVIRYDTGKKEDTYIENLEYRILYKLTELTPPEGHVPFEGERYIAIKKIGEEDPGEDITGVIPSGKKVEFFVVGETIRIANNPSFSSVTLSKRKVGGSEELPGARIRIEKLTGTADMASNDIIIKGGMTDVERTQTSVSFTSGSEPAVITGLPNGSYRMVEDAAPAGYKKTSSITFNVKKTGEGENEVYSVTVNGKAVQNGVIIMEDEITGMSISKQDVFGEELPGARLTLTGRDSSGSVIDLSAVVSDNDSMTASAQSVSFTSKDVPTRLSGLPEGHYVLHEDAAPAGYILAQDIPFAVDSAGNVLLTDSSGATGAVPENKLIMTDQRTYAVIKKTDMTGEPQIPGAVMQITGASYEMDFGNVKIYNGKDVNISGNVITFKTTTHEAEIRGLPAGRYVLTETAAPDGYKKAVSNFTFIVNPNGTVAVSGEGEGYSYDYVLHKITIKDEIEEIELTLGSSGIPISKVDVTKGIPQLSGATLTLKGDDSNGDPGSVLNAEVTTEEQEGSVKSIDGVTLTFVTGDKISYISGLTAGDYVLIENIAPPNYDLTTDFYFKVIIIDKTYYSVIPGKGNGYNTIKDGTIVIRDYPAGIKEDPDEPETEPSTTTQSTETVTETTEDEHTYVNVDTESETQPTETSPTETYPTVTYPTGPSYTGPHYTPSTSGPQFIDPIITGNLPSPAPAATDPLQSEDIKAGSYAVEGDDGCSSDGAAVAVSAAALTASAVYALSKALKRRRSK